MFKKNSLLFLFFLGLIGQLHAANRLFLENRYGAEIFCKVRNNNKTDKTMLMSNQETPIGNGVRVLLGLVPFDPKLTKQWVSSLDIKTSRYFFESSYTSLENYLDQMVKQLNACCSMKMSAPICQQGMCNKDAILVVKPSNIMSGWDVSVQWEAPWR